MKYISKSPTQTDTIALILAKLLRGGDVIFLRGGLGSGKTTLMKDVAKHLGIRETVKSPTFVLSKPYRIRRPGRSRANRFVHIDAYRLTSARDLAGIGWSEIAGQKQTIVAVENPGRMFGRFRPTRTIRLRTLASGRRVIEF